jgi:hypothetical protein
MISPARCSSVGSVDEVLARYSASRRVTQVTPIPVMSPIQKASKKRFGVAIAFVLLLVLFTLALSIVLKPRGRDLPLEISSWSPSWGTVPAQGGATPVFGVDFS